MNFFVDRRIVTACFSLFMVFLLTAPLEADPSTLPDWVKDPGKDYPPETFLTAVGSAPTLSAAREKAKSELSKIFSQHIEAVDELDQQVEETTKGTKSNFVEKVSQRTQISVSTSAELIGVQIEKTEEVFRDGRSRTYALAVLNKDEAATLYRERYLDNRRQLRETYRASRESDDPIQKLRLLAEARNYGETARRYRNQYVVLTSLGATASRGSASISDETIRENARAFASRMEENLRSDYSNTGDVETALGTPSVSEIEREIDELMSDMTLVIRPPEGRGIFGDEDYTRELGELIEEQFTRLGFRTVPDDQTPDVVVASRLSAESTTKGRRRDYAIHWRIGLRLIQSETNSTFGSINESGTTVGLDASMARTRTRSNINEWIESNLTDLIVEKLLST